MERTQVGKAAFRRSGTQAQNAVFGRCSSLEIWVQKRADRALYFSLQAFGSCPDSLEEIDRAINEAQSRLDCTINTGDDVSSLPVLDACCNTGTW